MQSLPLRAQVYLLAIYTAGAAAALYSRAYPVGSVKGKVGEFLIFMVLALLAGSRKVRLMRHKADDDVGSMSLGFAITYASLLRFGPSGAIVIGALSCLSGCFYPKRQPAYQMAFNMSLTVLESWIAGL